MKNITIHDAVKIIKYNGFLKNLKYYELILHVYEIIGCNKNGMYYIIIKNHDQFIDNAFLVDVLKKSFSELDFSETLDKIKDDNLTEYKVNIIRKKGINDELR